jgi:hypothetical protein
MPHFLLVPLILTRLHMQGAAPLVERVIEHRLDRPEITARELPWPSRQSLQIGRGIAVVFSPDLAAPDNRAFYEELGFTYVESADWREVFQQLQNADQKSELLIIESHGANGNGLKLQKGREADAARSYVSLGALQEQLEPLGVKGAIVSACNAGRLFRPAIYASLNPKNGDPLFLPATLGIIDAIGDDRGESCVRLFRRSRSQLETVVEATLSDFPAEDRSRFAPLLREGRFTISTMLMQLLIGDPALALTSRGFVDKRSSSDLGLDENERLLAEFVRLLSAGTSVASR